MHGQTEAFTVTGSAQADSITGGSGNDTITGGGGTDSLNGGTGADTIKRRHGQRQNYIIGVQIKQERHASFDGEQKINR